VRISSRAGIGRVLLLGADPGAVERAEPWRLLQAGASDVLGWKDASATSRQVFERLERWAAVDEFVASPVVRNHLVGETPVWKTLMRRAAEVARFTSASMLITGETGTGKELLARLVHTLDARPDKQDLVVLDCTTVVPTLSGSEFFGHERGAFTGAVASRDGAFATADRGTLFLDEVGELSIGLQSEILRVTQERTYKRVGSDTWRKTDFRLICATNRDLLEAQDTGGFRSDLYYRIAAWSCRMPPLRERREDIPILARHFLAESFPDGAAPEFDPAVMSLVMEREYPGNVRDLRQLIARVAQRHVGSGPITVGDVPAEERPVSVPAVGAWPSEEFAGALRRAVDLGISLREIGVVAVDTATQIALEREGGNVHRAARRLGVTDRALQLRRAKRRSQDGVQAGHPIVVLPASSAISPDPTGDRGDRVKGKEPPSGGQREPVRLRAKLREQKGRH
jgi:transcriptional regulator with GAF, ATPase, and Fis domain